jgi:hypothetical protein
MAINVERYSEEHYKSARLRGTLREPPQEGEIARNHPEKTVDSNANNKTLL